MSVLLALAAATLFGVGTYLVLQRKLSRIIIGLGLLTHGANVLLLTSGRGGDEPLIGVADTATIADPLPHALALTAIVITFGVSALLLAMAFRSWILRGDDEVENDVADTLVARGGIEPKEITDEERAEQQALLEEELAAQADASARTESHRPIRGSTARRPPTRSVPHIDRRSRIDVQAAEPGSGDVSPHRPRPHSGPGGRWS